MKFSIQGVYDWYRKMIRDPKYRWWIILGTLVYFVSPIDLIPDFPIIGQIDDAVLVTLLVSEVSQLLVDRLKSKNGTTATATDTQATSATNADPVDVKAVSVE